MSSVEVVHELSELQALAPDWNRLAERTGDPLLRHEWFLACAKAFSAPGALAIFVARDGQGGRVRAIAPFTAERMKLGFTRLVPLAQATTEPEALLFEDEAALREVLRAVLDRSLPLSFRRLKAGGAEARALAEMGAARGVLVERASSSRTAWAPLGGGWAAFEAQMSAKTRKSLRSRYHSANRVGGVTLEVLAPDERNLDELLAEAFRIEAAGWKSRNGTALVQTPRMRGFYIDYIQAAARLGYVRIFFLKIGGARVAMQISVLFGKRLWHLKMGYDEAWTKLSPGVLLTQETHRWASEHGLVGCEYLGLAEEWQRRWPVVFRDHSTIRFYPRTARGLLALGSDSLRFAVRRIGTMRAGKSGPGRETSTDPVG